MQTFREVSSWIRDYVNHPRHQQRLLSIPFSWNQLCTAMNTVDDVDLALEAYLATDFPDNDGEKYLRVYGVMQALFVQQHALRHLVEIVRPSIRLEATDVLTEIRDLRNASTGHPTELKRKTRSVHAISRISLGKNGFQMMSFDEGSGTSFKTVPVRELIEKHRGETARILLEIKKQLSKEDRSHREKFRVISLTSAFSQTTYAIEKIFEALRHPTHAGLATWGAEDLQTNLDQFESLLKERGIELDTYDSIKYLYQEIKYPLSELRKFLASQPSDIPRAEAAEVFADALRGHFSELRDIAQEIDEEYSLKDEGKEIDE